MKKTRKLHEILPREQVGARTAQQFEYQYCQVANNCFGLLESSEKISIYCEWHDDFVTEHEQTSIDIYAFTQVKTKALNKGPWKISEVFGAGGKTKALNEDSAFYRMFQNFLLFDSLCKKFIFVTNAGIDSDLENFLKDIHSHKTSLELSESNQKEFTKIVKLYTPKLGILSEDDFYNLIKRFEIEPEVGNLGDHIKLLRSQVEDHVKNYCEINLKRDQAERIAQNIIDLVRKKSQSQIKKIPIAAIALKEKKGIHADDVFDLLPLSRDGLNELKKGTASFRENLLSLSRLQRLGIKSNLPEALIKQMCAFKVQWELWILDNKLDIDSADLRTLKAACFKALDEKDLTFDAIGSRAKDICKEFNPKLPHHLQVDEALVLGFIFSIASQVEGSGNE